MYFSKFIILVLPLTVQASKLPLRVKRQGNLFLSNLQASDTSFKNYTKYTNSCTCTGSEAYGWVKCDYNITDILTKTANDCNAAPATPATTAAQAQTFINYVNNTLLVDVTTWANTYINKKSTFVPAGLGVTIRNWMAKHIKEVQAVCSCWKPRTPAAKQSAVQALCDRYVAQIERVRAAY